MKAKTFSLLFTLFLTAPLAAQVGIVKDITKSVNDTASEATRSAAETAKAAADAARKAAAEKAAQAAERARRTAAEQAAKAPQPKPSSGNPNGVATGADESARGIMKQIPDVSRKVDKGRESSEGRAVRPSDVDRRMQGRKPLVPDARRTVQDTTKAGGDARRMAQQKIEQAGRKAGDASQGTAERGKEMRAIPGKSIDEVKRRMVDDAKKAVEVVEPRPRPQEQRGQQLSEATGETRRMLSGSEERDRTEDKQKALSLTSESEASRLVTSILSGATRPESRQVKPEVRLNRLAPEEAGRTRQEREQTVEYFVNRFQGRDYPGNQGQRPGDRGHDHYHNRIHYYDGNRRFVRYRSNRDVPPILLASSRLHWVDVRPVREFTYISDAPDYYQEVPPAYSSEAAYGVSYRVDPNTVVSRDDILFQQGSTAFRDAYSFDIVADLAEAMLTSGLRSERFVIEGHASAEGSYESNLDLSQRRAERIARDLVAYGVSPARLVPVGYGETEANYPADARESLRSLDRRVMVFRLVE